MLAGDAGPDKDARGVPMKDDTLLIMMNAHHERIDFLLPGASGKVAWRLEIDTERPDLDPDEARAMMTGERVDVPGRTVLVWRLKKSRSEA